MIQFAQDGRARCKWRRKEEGTQKAQTRHGLHAKGSSLGHWPTKVTSGFGYGNTAFHGRQHTTLLCTASPPLLLSLPLSPPASFHATWLRERRRLSRKHRHYISCSWRDRGISLITQPTPLLITVDGDNRDSAASATRFNAGRDIIPITRRKKRLGARSPSSLFLFISPPARM